MPPPVDQHGFARYSDRAQSADDTVRRKISPPTEPRWYHEQAPRPWNEGPIILTSPHPPPFPLS